MQPASASKPIRMKRSIIPGQQFSPLQILIYMILVFWAITTVYPFFWIIINSFRVRNEIRTDSFSIPMGDSFTFENYEKAMSRYDFGSAYTNSLLISCVVTAVVLLLAGMAAYALVRYDFRGKKVCYGLLVASMMFPVFSTIIPVFRMEAAWGLASTSNRWIALVSVMLPQIAGNIAFATIVLMGFIKTLPIELEESAYLDGCSVFGIYFKIILPLARPSFATVAIFTFLWSYNDLFTQMFFLRYPHQFTITLMLNDISSQAGTNYGYMAAAVVLIVVPVLLVYMLLQKNIIKGLTAGAIKG